MLVYFQFVVYSFTAVGVFASRRKRREDIEDTLFALLVVFEAAQTALLIFVYHAANHPGVEAVASAVESLVGS